MKLTITTPSRAYVEFSPQDDPNDLRKALTFTNTSIAHDIKRHYNNFWARSKNPDRWESDLAELQRRAKRTLVFTDETGTWICPGSIPNIRHLNPTVDNNLVYPVPKKAVWKRPLPFTLHPYQTES